jgi:arylsulfatase A-like enzyme
MDTPLLGQRTSVLLAALLAVALGGTLSGCGARSDGGEAPAAVVPSPTRTLITPAPPERTEKPQRRPNVLVIEADDMRADELRWMPNVRRLLQRPGLTFENSFSPFPLCCPSRASFLTGQYAHNHRVFSHLEPFGFASFRDRRTLATALQRAGYRTALVGKYLNGYGEQALRSTGEPSLEYVPPGWTQWMAGSDHLWQLGEPVRGGTYAYFDLVQNINGRIVASPGRYSTDLMAEQTRGLIERFGRRKAPWFIWWNPVAPHHGMPVEHDDPVPTWRPDGLLTRWVTPARPQWVQGRFDDRITHGGGVPPGRPAEGDVADKPGYLRKLAPVTPAERAALTEVTRQRAESLFVLDLQIGRTVSQLSRRGELANTVIVFTSDNGYYLGEHRKRQGKINLHEPSLRVPLIVRGPGVPRGRRYDPVTTIDLAPTIAAYAGTRVRRADGIDLARLMTQGDRGWDRPVVTEGMMPEERYLQRHRLGPSPLNTRGLRLGRWKLTRYSTGEAELYDLATDPLELNNLARVPRYAGVLADLRRLHRRYRDCAGTECSVPVPPRYRVDADEVRRITEGQKQAARIFFRRD